MEIVEKVVAMARIHRAIALIKKDLADLEHDRANGTEAPILLLSDEGSEKLALYIDTMMKIYDSNRQRYQFIEADEGSQIGLSLQRLIDQELALEPASTQMREVH